MDFLCIRKNAQMGWRSKFELFSNFAILLFNCLPFLVALVQGQLSWSRNIGFFRPEYLPIFGLVVLSLILLAPGDEMPTSFDHPRPLGLGHLSLYTCIFLHFVFSAAELALSSIHNAKIYVYFCELSY